MVDLAQSTLTNLRCVGKLASLIPDLGEWQELAASVRTRRRQEVDFLRDGTACQSQLAVTPEETRA